MNGFFCPRNRLEHLTLRQKLIVVFLRNKKLALAELHLAEIDYVVPAIDYQVDLRSLWVLAVGPMPPCRHRSSYPGYSQRTLYLVNVKEAQPLERKSKPSHPERGFKGVRPERPVVVDVVLDELEIKQRVKITNSVNLVFGITN
jgi:hypothetical protein